MVYVSPLHVNKKHQLKNHKTVNFFISDDSRPILRLNSLILVFVVSITGVSFVKDEYKSSSLRLVRSLL